MYQKLLKQFIESAVNVSSTTLSQREHNLLYSFSIWLDLHAEEQSTEKDAPMTLTDMPRPWSTDEMNRGEK